MEVRGEVRCDVAQDQFVDFLIVAAGSLLDQSCGGNVVREVAHQREIRNRGLDKAQSGFFTVCKRLDAQRDAQGLLGVKAYKAAPVPLACSLTEASFEILGGRPDKEGKVLDLAADFAQLPGDRCLVALPSSGSGPHKGPISQKCCDWGSTQLELRKGARQRRIDLEIDGQALKITFDSNFFDFSSQRKLPLTLRAKLSGGDQGLDRLGSTAKVDGGDQRTEARRNIEAALIGSGPNQHLLRPTLGSGLPPVGPSSSASDRGHR